MKTNSNGHGSNGHGSMRARPRSEQGVRQAGNRRATSRAEQLGIVVLCAAAGVVGAFAPAEPTVLPAINALLNGLFAAATTWACSRARRWTWLVVTGVVVLLAQDAWLAVGAVALAIALVASLVSRHRIYGAVVGGLAVQGLLRLPEVSFPLGSVLVVVATLLPVFVSAYILSPRRVRRRVRWTLYATALLFLAGGILLGIAALLAYRPSLRGVDQAQAGLTQVREGSNTKATELLKESAKSFDEANDRVTAPWAAPALAVPIISQHLHALDEVTQQGSAVTTSAASTAAGVNYDELRYRNGRVDVDALRKLQRPLITTAAVLDNAVNVVHNARSPWLLGPLTEKIDDFQRELDAAAPQADLAANAAAAVPGLLGADGTRHYFVAFITPAENRGSGGFMGNWAELTAENGHLTMTRTGRAEDLNQLPGRLDRTVTAPADYVSRYQRFQPGYFVQDVTLSPDLPSVGQAMNQLYQQMGGAPLDGMMTVDPYGLAALLDLTGPIKIAGSDQPLTKDNAADLLITKQYTQFAGRNDERKDFLDDAGKATFDKLIHTDLPSPRQLGDVLGPMVDQHRIKFTSLTPKPTAHTVEQRLIDEMGAGGQFPAKGDGDFFSLVTQNKANNKIDIFMHRKVVYSSSFDPETGQVKAHATVTIRNDAPPDGLPDAVIGSNDQGLPKGTNQLFFSFYSPLGLREARIDQQPTPLEYQVEFGYAVFSKFLTIPPGGTVTVELDLSGKLRAGNTYSLAIYPQPTVNADDIVVTADVPPSWSMSKEHRIGTDGLSIEPGGSKAAMAITPRELIQTKLDLVER